MSLLIAAWSFYSLLSGWLVEFRIINEFVFIINFACKVKSRGQYYSFIYNPYYYEFEANEKHPKLIFLSNVEWKSIIYTTRLMENKLQRGEKRKRRAGGLSLGAPPLNYFALTDQLRQDES